jgi:hypothetical protein
MDDWPPPPLTPREPIREERWRLMGASGKPVICTVEDVGDSYEVRVGYSEHEVLYTRLLSSLVAARHFADNARPMLMKRLGLTESNPR